MEKTQWEEGGGIRLLAPPAQEALPGPAAACRPGQTPAGPLTTGAHMEHCAALPAFCVFPRAPREGRPLRTGQPGKAADSAVCSSP